MTVYVMKNKAQILFEYDGWQIIVNGKTYRYNHNDEDYGVHALAVLLTDLGFEAEIEEVC
tara:strand:- start:456 stop:635 length:180 start_codon:yes stop_codon:yes gene_type:complete